MPDPPDHEQLPKDDAEPTSSYLASELGALWAFLRSRHREAEASPQHLQPETEKKTMAETLTRPQLEAQLTERAWTDDAFRAELLADPTAVIQRELQALGIALPAGLTIGVHQETPSEIHLVLPLKPGMAEDQELTDEDLDLVAGGSGEMPGSNIAIGSIEDDPSQPSCK